MDCILIWKLAKKNTSEFDSSKLLQMKKLILLSTLFIFACQKPTKISEKEGHHPDIKFGWGYSEIKITTHSIKGLSENDFILASKIDNISLF